MNGKDCSELEDDRDFFEIVGFIEFDNMHRGTGNGGDRSNALFTHVVVQLPSLNSPS